MNDPLMVSPKEMAMKVMTAYAATGEFIDPYRDMIMGMKTNPYSHIDFYVLLDESDNTEWIAFGCGNNKQLNTDELPEEVVDKWARNAGLVGTRQIYTIKRGEPMEFTRVVPLKDVSPMEKLMGAPANAYLMQVYKND